jgi:alanine dehydrogenase
MMWFTIVWLICPGGVPRTSTLALNKATLPLLVKIADQGYEKIPKRKQNLLAGLNLFKGAITCKGVAGCI